MVVKDMVTMVKDKMTVVKDRTMIKDLPAGAGHYLDLWSHQLTRDVEPPAIDTNNSIVTIHHLRVKYDNIDTTHLSITRVKYNNGHHLPFNTIQYYNIFGTPLCFRFYSTGFSVRFQGISCFPKMIEFRVDFYWILY